MKQNIVIVGGGLAGLTAATYLARGGHDVTLFEQTSDCGGMAKTQNKDGFYYNQGPHALYLGAKGTQALYDLEIPFTGMTTNVTIRTIKNKKNYLFPIDEKTIYESELLSDSGKKALLKFYKMLPTIDTTKIQNVPLDDWLNENVIEPDAISFIYSLIRLNTFVNEPQIQSAGVTMNLMQVGNAGVMYVDKGWQTLVDGLEQKAKSFGAKITTGKKVVSVEFDNAVKGIVLSNGTKVDASIVILATPPSTASKLLKNKIPQIEEFANSAIPVKTASLDVALSGFPNPDNHFALGVDSPVYLSVHSLFGQLAPENGTLISLAKYLSDSNKEEPKKVEAELEEVLDLMQPDWRKYLVKKRFLPGMITANAVATATQNGYDGRPMPKIEQVQNLYVVGDWVGKEGWLSGASLSSAKQAAELIISKTSIM